MRGAAARRVTCVLGMAVAALLGTRAAGAFEFFDGRIQLHGFYETQIRSIARDFEPSDGWDLTQWYHVLNLELEADIAPDGFGPFDLISSFVRVDVRYDCVWERACGLARSADAFGDRSGRLPNRVTDRRRSGLNGHVRDGDFRRFSGIPRDQLGIRNVINLGLGNGPRIASDSFTTPGIEGFFGIAGLPSKMGDEQGTLEDANDPANVAFGDLLGDECRFGYQKLKGSNDGNGGRTLPWDPGCEPVGSSISLNFNKPNPFRGETDFFGAALAPSGNVPMGISGGDFNDVSLRGWVGPGSATFQAGAVGFGELPLRPAPRRAFDDPGVRLDEAQGIYLPSAPLAKRIREGRFNSPDQSFEERELKWNRGASQKGTQELKEAYLDLEFFDSRLWIRAGKQQIVWGKTELFRTTDQFNPQDFALASLPSLEESRIGLWALRAVWSFYDVGPFEDVRLELAANFDEFEPADLGRCGEPYTPLPVCDKTFGLLAHSFAGIALAGEERPEDPWHGTEGLEGGARLEWRWDRFSFALTNFYGFNDTPYTEQIMRYSRNVDPITGRPRVGMSEGDCDVSVFSGGPALQPGGGARRWTPGSVADPDCLTPDNALANHSVNQTLFHLVCASSIGFTDLDLTVCGQSVFNSITDITLNVPATNPISQATIASLLANFLAGAPNSASPAGLFGGMNFHPTLRALNVDPCDGLLVSGCDLVGAVTAAELADEAFNLAGMPVIPFVGPQPDINTPNVNFFFSNGGADPTMNSTLTQQQKALLGCGEFYGTNCEINGVDLMNAEVSALMQSWVGIEGTGIDGIGVGGDTTENVPQPGTIGFVPFRGPFATRLSGGVQVTLPGSRGPNDFGDVFDDDSGYDPFIDGCSGFLGAAAAILTPGCNAGDAVPEGSRADGATVDGLRDAAAVRLFHPFAGRDPGLNGVFDLAADGGIGGTDDCFTGPDGLCGTGDDGPQFFASEIAALSFNAMMTTVALSFLGDDDGDGTDEVDVDEFDPSDPFRTDGCSFVRPIHCSAMAAFWAITGVQRNTVNAGGNGRFGRRDFIWHGGSQLVARYEKRNVLGLSIDVAEDITKTNWSFEFTWINNLPFTNNNEVEGISRADTYNLTVSVDRPTFINFLNANRTFFFNSQWFFQYVDGYNKGFTSNGPWNVLGTLTFFTGYFQDRLLPTTTLVYDMRSNSGAVLPSITYRFTEAFSAQLGVAAFFGRQNKVTTPLTPTLVPDRAGKNAYDSFAENGLSLVRERDEVFMRIKYTF